MKSEQLLKCMGMIDDKFLLEAESYEPKAAFKRKRMTAVLSAAACICIAAVSVFAAMKNNSNRDISSETSNTDTSSENSAETVYEETDSTFSATETVYTPTETEIFFESENIITGTEVSVTETTSEKETAVSETTVNCTTVFVTESDIPEKETTVSETTVNFTTAFVTESDIPENEDVDLEYEDPKDLPDFPVLDTFGAYMDLFFEKPDLKNISCVTIGYEYIDPTYNVSTMKYVDVDYGKIKSVLDECRSKNIGADGLKNEGKYVSVIFKADNETYFEVNFRENGKAVIYSSNYIGSAEFALSEDIYSSLYSIASEIGGFVYFDQDISSSDSVNAEE